MKRSSAVAMCILLLQGCVATSSGKLDAHKVATFKPGVTTLRDAEVALGHPYLDTKLPDGSHVLQYVSTVKEAAGDGMPTTGSEIPKRNAKNVSLMLAFDPHGHFLRAWSDSKEMSKQWPSNLGNVLQGDVEWAPGRAH